MSRVTAFLAQLVSKNVEPIFIAQAFCLNKLQDKRKV